MSFQPQYVITDKLLKLVASAEASKEIIENSLIVPLWERNFQNNALVRSVHHSTALEGNRLDFDEAKSIVAGNSISTVRIRDVKEIINYRDVIGFVSGTQLKALTIGLINSIHGHLGKGILEDKYLAKFRKNNAVIVNSRTEEIVFEASAPEDLTDEINDLIVWDKSAALELHPLIRAGIIHYEFVRIHPYADLNGRTARILTTWSLYRDGYDIKRFFSLEEYYDQNPKRYYDALDSGHSGDLSYWLEYFSEGVSEELLRIKKKILSVSRDVKLKNQIGQIALNEKQLEIIKYLEDKGEIRNPDFSILFPDLSEDTILRNLSDLIKKQIVKKLGRTKAARYVLK